MAVFDPAQDKSMNDVLARAESIRAHSVSEAAEAKAKAGGNAPESHSENAPESVPASDASSVKETE